MLVKIQEDYPMYEDHCDSDQEDQDDEEHQVHPIPEVENEDDYEEPQENDESFNLKLELARTKLKEKTLKINELQQSLLQSRKFKEQQIKAFESRSH